MHLGLFFGHQEISSAPPKRPQRTTLEAERGSKGVLLVKRRVILKSPG
jgi:hypothetical protein